mmetsp:Transcript_13796/g.30053  ORF Transcript_13796/g.30053 Transcript_13796/m.30053 type:complete len:232 (-) Transcript_13796:127-822(-)
MFFVQAQDSRASKVSSSISSSSSLLFSSSSSSWSSWLWPASSFSSSAGPPPPPSAGSSQGSYSPLPQSSSSTPSALTRSSSFSSFFSFSFSSSSTSALALVAEELPLAPVALVYQAGGVMPRDGGGGGLEAGPASKPKPAEPAEALLTTLPPTPSWTMLAAFGQEAYRLGLEIGAMGSGSVVAAAAELRRGVALMVRGAVGTGCCSVSSFSDSEESSSSHCSAKPLAVCSP